MLNTNCPYLEEKCSSSECDCAKFKAYQKVNEPGVIESKLKELGFSVDMETFNLLMGMQHSFAKSLHKVDNLTKDEMDHWLDRYLVCIEDEVREVREHLTIYPDDTKPPHKVLKELQKEIIDILHFVMDLFICGGATPSQIKEYYLKTYNLNESTYIGDFLDYAYNQQFMELTNNYTINKDIDVLLLANKLLDANSSIRQQISWKHWKKQNDTIDQEALFVAFAKTFKALVDLFIIVDLEPDQVKKVYVLKNMENIFRQTFNY